MHNYKKNIELLFPLVLGSQSPRRQEILRLAGFSFTTNVVPTDEIIDESLKIEDIPCHLSDKKADAFFEIYGQEGLYLFADTVVVLDKKILNKPANFSEAQAMLRQLSGKQHQVITGVTLQTPHKREHFYDIANVTFKDLSEAEIEFYIQTCKPFDKAGSYGIQDFIGMVGITRLEGSFYTVMGLPIHLVYQHLQPFIKSF